MLLYATVIPMKALVSIFVSVPQYDHLNLLTYSLHRAQSFLRI